LRHQHRQLGFGASSTHMLENDVAPGATLGELDLRAARAPLRLPHEHHWPDPTDPRGVSITPSATCKDIDEVSNLRSGGTSQAAG
jgi:hypothetical protein